MATKKELEMYNVGLEVGYAIGKKQNQLMSEFLGGICVASIVVILIIVFMLGNAKIAHGATLESNEGSSIDTENYGTTAGKGQSFQHENDFDIDSIEIWGGLGDDPGTTITVDIYEGEGMGGTLLCTESAVDVSGWPNWSSADWQVITISCPSLTASQQYTFEITADDGGTNDAIRWATSNTAYGDGTEYYNQSQRGTRDTMFRINGTASGGGTSTATTSTSTVDAINNLNVTLLTGLGFIMLLLGLLIPLWIFKYIRP